MQTFGEILSSAIDIGHHTLKYHHTTYYLAKKLKFKKSLSTINHLKHLQLQLDIFKDMKILLFFHRMKKNCSL